MNNVHELLNCPICLDRFEEPKILPCHHSFCSKCINNVISNGQVDCPTCRATHDASLGFQNDFRTNQLLDCENNLNVYPEDEAKLPCIQPSAPPVRDSYQEYLVRLLIFFL
jgi:hypothetical protein